MMEVLVFVDGVDAMTSKVMQARRSYEPSEMMLNEQVGAAGPPVICTSNPNIHNSTRAPATSNHCCAVVVRLSLAQLAFVGSCSPSTLHAHVSLPSNRWPG
jgi:hypothetical protein